MGFQTVKIVCDGDIRRVKFDSNPKLKDIASHVQSYFGLAEFALTYKDEEGDILRVSLDSELTEAFEVAGAQKKILKLTVSPCGSNQGTGTDSSETEKSCRSRRELPREGVGLGVWQSDVEQVEHAEALAEPLGVAGRSFRKSMSAPEGWDNLDLNSRLSAATSGWHEQPRLTSGGHSSTSDSAGSTYKNLRARPPPPKAEKPKPASDAIRDWRAKKGGGAPTTPPKVFPPHPTAPKPRARPVSSSVLNALQQQQPQTPQLVPPPANPWCGAKCTVTFKAKFIKDMTLPDRSEVAPLQTLVKTWTVSNCGPTSWPKDTVCKLFRSCNGQVAEPDARFPVRSAAPGEVVDVSVIIRTPPSPGRCRAFFRLATHGNRFFGPRMWLDIYVKLPKEEEKKPLDKQLPERECHDPCNEFELLRNDVGETADKADELFVEDRQQERLPSMITEDSSSYGESSASDVSSQSSPEGSQAAQASSSSLPPTSQASQDTQPDLTTT
eukprot:g1052.t1